MSPDRRPASPPVSALAECPHCSRAAGRMNLLTSMTRYYSCDDCNRRWNVPRGAPPERRVDSLLLVG